MKASQQRREKYYRIYDALYAEPFAHVSDLSKKTKIPRNTVTKYLRDMYEKAIMRGPHLSLNPASNYEEYIYLLNFSDPFLVVRWLNEVPHILQTAASFGEWNTLITADTLLDVSLLSGFRQVVYQGSKGFSFTPKAVHTSWDDAFARICEENQLLPEKEPKKKILLDWKEPHWRLFHTFKYDTRGKVTSTLKKARVTYETYKEWMKTLGSHCTIHTGFYPEGYFTCMTHCFLFLTDYRESVKFLFSLFPSTPFMVEMGEDLLVCASVPYDVNCNVMCMVYDMRRRGIINDFKSAVLLTQGGHDLRPGR